MVVALHVNTERGWRGGEQHVLWLAQAQKRHGARALVAARPRRPLAGRAADAGLEVVSCAPSGELALFAAASLRSSIRRHGVNVVHAHSAHAAAVAALAIRRTDARFVLSRHVEYPLKRNVLSRWKYNRADAIIALSAAASRGLVASNIDEGRIEVIPGGVDLTTPVVPASRAMLRSLGVVGRGPLVVMVSAITAEKDPLVFVRAIHEAAQRVPSLEALLVGDGDQRGAVERLARDLGLGGTLHVAGFQPDAQAIAAAADVAVLTTSTEGGLPLALLEAMACGRPVVATRAGGVSELIVPGHSGLIEAVGDFRRLGAAIANVLSDSLLAARLAENARSRAQEFSIDHTATRTLALYERVLAAAA